MSPLTEVPPVAFWLLRDVVLAIWLLLCLQQPARSELAAKQEAFSVQPETSESVQKETGNSSLFSIV